MFDLHGKTALVTGSSRGIGKSILLSLADQGANVVLHCRSESKEVDELISSVKKKGISCHAVYADLSKADGSNHLYDQIRTMGISIDILVLNASIELRRRWLDITDNEFDLQMNANFRAPMKLVQLFVPDMQARKWGRIITIGSVQQKKPHPDMMVYSATKMALLNLVLSLAPQLAPHGVTINNIAPGAIRTDRNKDALADKDYEEKVCKLIPMQYIGIPEDIAGLVVYLASSESRYITGQDIYISGGKDL